MNIADAPKKHPVPFGVNGQRENLLSSTPAGDNTASYSDGFPPVTMILKSAGGLPPKGQDINQILFELSNLSRWSSAGGLNSFDANFCNAIGGYPLGAIIIGDDGKTLFQCSLDGNKNNPNTTVTGWTNINNQYLSRANPFADIKSDGTLPAALFNLGQGGYCIDKGTANNIQITIPGTSVTTVPAGFPIDICVAQANTGPTTITVNGGKAYPLWGNVGALQGGEIGSTGGIVRVIMNNTGSVFFLVGQNTGGALQTSQGVYSNHAVSLGQFGKTLSAAAGADSGLTSVTASSTFTPVCNGVVMLNNHAFSSNGINNIQVSVSGAGSSVVSQEQQFTSSGSGGAIVSVKGKISTTINLTVTSNSSSGMKASFTGIFIPTT